MSFKSKRLFAIIATLAMLFSLVPATGLAQDNEPTEAEYLLEEAVLPGFWTITVSEPAGYQFNLEHENLDPVDNTPIPGARSFMLDTSPELVIYDADDEEVGRGAVALVDGPGTIDLVEPPVNDDPPVVDPVEERIMEGADYSARPVRTMTTGMKDIDPYVTRVTVEADDDSEFTAGEEQRLFVELPARTAFAIDTVESRHDGVEIVGFDSRGVEVTDGLFREWIIDVSFDADLVIEDGDEILRFAVNPFWTAPGFSGDVEASFSGSPGSLFSADELVIARIAPAALEMSVREINFITDSNIENNIGTLRFTENMADATNSVKMTLPRGFYWDTAVTDVVVQERYNMMEDETTIPVEYEDRADVPGTRYRSVVMDFSDVVDPAATSSWDVLGIFDIDDPRIDNVLRIMVDPAMAQKGEVDVTVADAAPSELTIAIYGDYVAQAETVDTPLLLSGKFQNLGEFEIREDIAGSMVEGRTITLTLPEGAKWRVPDEDTMTLDPADAPSIVGAATERRGLEFGTRMEAGAGNELWQVVDTARRTIRTTILQKSEVPARAGALLTFEEGNVALAPDFEGDLVVDVGGSAGATGEVTLGEVKPPVDAEIETEMDLEIGKTGQAIGDITLTEAKAGAASRTDAQEGIITLQIPLPYGATFTSTPEAEVTDGDMIIERIWRSADRTAVNIQVAASSDEASEIVISDLELTIDRAAPDGPVHLHVKGDALIDENGDRDTIFSRLYFLDSDVLHDLVVGEIVDEITPTEVVMWIGETTYQVDGVDHEMDAAPFIQDGRTMVPVRFVAESFGLEADWGPQDELTEWVTFEKDDLLLELEIGSYDITVTEDGVERTVVSDVAPMIENGRTYLPLRVIGEMFNADFDWGPKDQLTAWVSFTYWK